MIAEQLSETFCISLDQSRVMLQATTQRGTRSVILPLSRHYCADRRFNIQRLQIKFATDTLWGKINSLTSNMSAQIYLHKCGFKKVYHMKATNSKNVRYLLTRFISNFGAPDHLTFDGATVQKGTNTLFYNTLRRTL